MESNQGQKSGWYKSLSIRMKILFSLGLITQVVYTIYSIGYGYPNFPSYTGRSVGFFLAIFLPAFVISLVVGAIPYFIFRNIAEKWTKYLDYVAVVFLMVSIIFVYSGLKTQQRIDDYRTLQRNSQF